MNSTFPNMRLSNRSVQEAEELPSVYESEWVNGVAKVTGKSAQKELADRGYGEEARGGYELKDYEASYLLYIGKLKVKRSNNELPMDELAKHALKKDPNAWTRFIVYRDMRSRGYVAKEGFGFGMDFRVYDRGTFGTKPAKYVVFAMNEGTEMPVRELSNYVAQITRMGKEAVIAVVERRGEVIYYNVSKAKLINRKT